MKKNIIILSVVCALGLSACTDENNEVVTPEMQEVTFLQTDSVVTRSVNGRLIQSNIMTYDSKGNTTSVREEKHDEVFYWENFDFDEKGREQKQIVYFIDNGEKILYSTTEYEYSNDCHIYIIDEIFGECQKIVDHLDANGRVTKSEVYLKDENDDFQIYFVVDNTYDEHGNIIKEVYTDPLDEDYYVEDNYEYTYQKFGNLTQYTSKTMLSQSAKEVYEYDDRGNNTLVKYYKYENGVEKLDEKIVMEVDYNLLAENVYGSKCVPWQPNAYQQSKIYNAYDKHIATTNYYRSVHHTVPLTRAAANKQNVGKIMYTKIKKRPEAR